MGAKVKLSTEFESLSGRLCRRNGAVIALNKKTGKMYRYDYHKPTQPNSAKQQAVKVKFADRAKVASGWWKANKPVEGQVVTEEYKILKKAYDAQKEIGNIYGYLLSCVTESGTIIVGSTAFVKHDTDGLG